MTSAISIIWVTGPWSSGSTALTGWLERLGAYGCPPYQKTNDVRTPNSYESKALRDKLCEHRNELTLLKNPNKTDDDLRAWFLNWIEHQEKLAKKSGASQIVLKHPILAFYIEKLRQPKDKMLLITRGLKEIERTRLRRNWHPIYGRAGARTIYSNLFNTYLREAIPYTAVPFNKFLKDQKYRTELTTILNINFTDEEWVNAESWLKKDGR